jgi:hypothetical protein
MDWMMLMTQNWSAVESVSLLKGLVQRVTTLVFRGMPLGHTKTVRD